MVRSTPLPSWQVVLAVCWVLDLWQVLPVLQQPVAATAFFTGAMQAMHSLPVRAAIIASAITMLAILRVTGSQYQYIVGDVQLLQVADIRGVSYVGRRSD